MYSEEKITDEAVKVRIETLKANRIFYVILFAVESAVLTIAIQYSMSLPIEFWIALGLLFVSIILLLLGIFILTDSIRFYSEYSEYRSTWYKKIGVKYPNKTSEEKITENFKRGSKADDVSYNCLRLSLLFFFYFFASLFFAVGSLDIYLRMAISIGMGVFFTLLFVWAYRGTHEKPWEKNLSENS